MNNDRAKKSLSVSMIAGIMLVPLTAVAALWLTGQEKSAAETPESTTTTSVPLVTVANPTSPDTTIDLERDLLMACGPDGMELVALEESGKITDVQQAALDALREVCDQEGLALPEKPVPDPIVQKVVIPAATATTVAAATSTTSDDGYEYEDDEYDDEYEDDEYEDDEYEDDEDEHEEEHEDEDHGSEHEDDD